MKKAKKNEMMEKSKYTIFFEGKIIENEQANKEGINTNTYEMYKMKKTKKRNGKKRISEAKIPYHLNSYFSRFSNEFYIFARKSM